MKLSCMTSTERTSRWQLSPRFNQRAECGRALTDKALRFIADKTYQDQDFLCNYTGRSKDERTLRASTMFIKDDGGRLIGMLCINFDPSCHQKPPKTS